MPTEKILFTACPQGVSGGERKLLVHLAPQLSGATQLSEFAALSDWPKVAASLSLRITVGASATIVKPTLDPRADELWKAIFPGATRVVPFEYGDLHTRFILSYPASLVGAAIRQLYSGLATGVQSGLPNLSVLARTLEPLVPVRQGEFRAERAVALVKSTAANGVVEVPTGTLAEVAAQSILLGRAFHAARNPKPSAAFSGKETLDDLDFHGIVGQLGEYPELLKKLDLIFEVSVPAGAADGTVFVEPIWEVGAPAIVAVSPRTTVSAAFLPGGDARIEDGYLALQKPSGDFVVTNFDIDAALGQLVSLAESLFATASLPSLDTPRQTGLAPLRSSGFSLLQLGRAVKLKERLAAAFKMGSGATPTLDAGALNRGWRVDVREVEKGQPGPWRSLCRRLGDYAFPLAPSSAPLMKLADEGTVRSVATEQEGHPELYFHEALFSWDGWSLCAPRPVKAVPSEEPVSVSSAPLPVKATFEAEPGSLASLRFGKLYQFRVRTVDLAGGGLGFEDKGGEAHASVPTPYGRYEPVPPPVVILQAKPGAGESAERIVVRSLGPTLAILAPSVRHLSPPRVSLEAALTHGVLDDSSGKPDAQKMAAALTQDADFPSVALPDVFHPDDHSRDARAILVSEAEAKIPYLPDPLCAGAVLAGDVGSGNLPFAAGEWPEGWKTVRVRLEEGPAGVKAESGELVVSLPKAGRATFRLASLLPPEGLEKLGLWQWIEWALSSGQITPASFEALKQLAQISGHWMLTPSRELTFVHAVLQPLEAPMFTLFNVRRVPDQPLVVCEAELTCDAKSTGQLDIEAAWSDAIDDISKPLGATPIKEGGRASFFSVPLRFPGEDVPSGMATIHDETGKTLATWEGSSRKIAVTPAALGNDGALPVASHPDVRYRRLRWTAVASTRFREYFLPADIEGKPTTQKSVEAVVDIPNIASPATPRVAFVVPTFGWNRKVTTSTRRCGLRVYLERPWFSSGEGELLAVVCAEGDISPSLEPSVTQLGSDPIWLLGNLPHRPGPALFSNRLPLTEGDTLTVPGNRIAPKDFVTTNLPLPGLDPALRVAIAAFPVLPDPASGLWYADIEVDTAASYFPFVRLSLARYQPRSMPGAHLSGAVTTDFAQLLPGRSLNVTKLPGSVTVSVSGPAPASSVFEATVERLLNGASDLEWRAAGAAVTLVPSGQPDNLTRTGSVSLPPASGGQLRLAVREWEVIAGGRRLVYAENWPLTTAVLNSQ